MLGPALAFKPVLDLAGHAVIQREHRAVDDLADLVLGLVVQLGGTFAIGTVGFREHFSHFRAIVPKELAIPPGHVREVGRGLAREELGHQGVERLLIVGVGDKLRGQRLRFQGEFFGLERRESLPGVITRWCSLRVPSSRVR